MLKLLLCAVYFSLAFGCFANEEEERANQELADQVFGLNWVGTGTYKLTDSESNLSVPDNCAALVNEDARKIMRLLGEQARKVTSAEQLPPEEDMMRDIAASEAFLLPGFDFSNMIIFQNFDEGYVSLEDWDQVEPAKILASVQEKEGNVIGWIHEPTLLREADLFYCIFERDIGNERAAEILLFHFGRHGFVKISTTPSLDLNAPHALVSLIERIHAFEPGNRHADYIPGDKKADYNIAALLLDKKE